jgi:hypothetical protein
LGFQPASLLSLVGARLAGGKDWQNNTLAYNIPKDYHNF